jgi:hypothetical protein
MQPYDYEWQTDDVTEQHWLWFFGDQHYGSRDCAVGHMMATIAKIRMSARSRVVLMGDCCDFVNYSDKRFDVRMLAPQFVNKMDDLPRTVADGFITLLQDIRKQIICLIPGNHDDHIRRKYHFDVAGYIAGCLGIPLLPQVAWLEMRLISHKNVRRSLRVGGVLAHAERGATTRSGRMSTTERMAHNFAGADFFAQAHMHGYNVEPVPQVVRAGAFGKPRLEHKTMWLFQTGSYLKTYGDGVSGYGEKRGYSPVELGSPRLGIRRVRTSLPTGKTCGKSVDYTELKGEL